MRRLWRWAKRLIVALIVVIVALALPPLYIEVGCRGEIADDGYTPRIADANWHREESRTLLTYPEWHIVHAYDDYARVVSEGDPHDFQYLRAIAQFWTTLCPLNEAAGAMGGVSTETKATIYTIGVSFTAELLAKAAYEETLGRLATWMRGKKRAELDELHAAQSREYALFLQQTPWYLWDFSGSADQLSQVEPSKFRDRERRLALGLEYRAKAAYADVIAEAVAGIGADELRIRLIVSGLTEAALASIEGVTVIARLGEGHVIEADRYRVFTRTLERLAAAGGTIEEIAGNDEILFTVTTEAKTHAGAVASFTRQGYGDTRHLILVPVSELADRIRALDGVRLEHVHDY